MTLEEYINKHGSSYPTTQIAFQDFCDIIESESYRAISLTQDLPIARLINYVNTNTNDAIDLNELLSSSVDGMRLFAEYCSQNPNYGSYRIPLLNPYLGVEQMHLDYADSVINDFEARQRARVKLLSALKGVAKYGKCS